MSHELADPKQVKANSAMNSFLLFVTLAVLGFIGNETWSNGKKLESISAAQITRPEFESKMNESRMQQETKMNEFRVAQDVMRAKLVELEIAVARLNQKP